jgi:glycosyltransferase involved in cell wall biosynthesis
MGVAEERDMNADSRAPIFSVIVPTRNRPVLLAKALFSLKNQTVPAERFEVLVVDSGSADHTREIVREAEMNMKNLRYFFTAIPGLHAARHLGMENAHGDILVYCDDDVEALPTWLEAIAAGFSRTDAAMVGGKCLPKFESDPPRWLLKRWTTQGEHGKFLGFLSILDFGETVKEIPPTYVIGCNFAIRRQSLLAAGGFHPDSMPAELLFYRGDGETWVGRAVAAQGGKALYHPGATVCHFVPEERMTLDYFYRRAFAEGISRSFAHIRKTRLIDNLQEDDSPPRRSWQQRSHRFLLDLSMALPCHHPLFRAEKKGWRDGFRSHQERFHADPELRAWVLRANWLEHAGPARRT